MSVKNIPTRVCDVLECGNIAKHTCSVCGIDLCSSEQGHTHKFGDGCHISHSVRIDVLYWPYGGREQIYMCPMCFTSVMPVSLFSVVKQHGEQIDQK